MMQQDKEELNDKVKRRRKRATVQSNTGKPSRASLIQPTRKKQLQGRLQTLAVLELRQDGYVIKYLHTYYSVVLIFGS
jgi:hypothetical protein